MTISLMRNQLGKANRGPMIKGLRISVCGMSRVKLIFEMNPNHHEVQSGLSTLDAIVA